MKAITYIVALLLPAIASGLLESTLRLDDVVPDETEVESRGFERKLGNRVLGSKSTKGGKGGKGSKGSKGSNCESHRVYYEIDDYKEKVSIIGTGDAELGFAVDRVKVFDAKSTKAVGFVTETSIAAGEFDCTVSGAFSFGAKAGRSSNQVFYQGMLQHCTHCANLLQ
jgi:hypothetical protein